MNLEMFRFLLIIIFSEQIRLVTSQQCSYEYDIDYKSGTTPIDLNFIFASSPQDCCKQCSLTSMCQAWTYVSLTKLCWIKNGLGVRTYSPGRISGTKQNGIRPTRLPVCSISSRYNYYGNDLLSVAVSSPSECCTRCGRTNGCVAWVFFTDYKYPLVANCYLKYTRNTNDRRHYYANIISGELVYKY